MVTGPSRLDLGYDSQLINGGLIIVPGLITMAMPGRLTWSATYNQASQRISERLSNGASTTRQFTNVFYTTGPLAGLPQTAVDLGRSVTNTIVYDAFRRVATNSATGQMVGASCWKNHATYEAARPGAREVVADFVEKHTLRERARLTLRMLLTDVPRGVVL